MATTTKIEIETALLDRLRSRYPGKDDRELIERLARIELGLAALRDSQSRNGLSEDEAIGVAVQEVHASRAESA